MRDERGARAWFTARHYIESKNGVPANGLGAPRGKVSIMNTLSKVTIGAALLCGAAALSAAAPAQAQSFGFSVGTGPGYVDPGYYGYAPAPVPAPVCDPYYYGYVAPVAPAPYYYGPALSFGFVGGGWGGNYGNYYGGNYSGGRGYYG